MYFFRVDGPLKLKNCNDSTENIKHESKQTYNFDSTLIDNLLMFP